MTESKQAPISAAGNSLKMLQAMVGIGIICALMIVLTFQGTAPIIKVKKAEALEKAIFKVLPGIDKTQTFQLGPNDSFAALEGEGQEGKVAYAGYSPNGELVGVAVEASGQGYADIIRILYGYDPEKQQVVGFYVLESKETPGLGDKIEKDAAFLANFSGLEVSLADDQSTLKNKPVTVKHGTKENPWEIDAITGATISSRAIGDIMGASTEHWAPLIHKNKEAFGLKANENTQK
ncbi:MAG: FMN-binding protein [Lewinellaceae bacterium]|nr:FMN-binding protein [Phaeodactylibacter sp.]MCB0614447.1 FMN-binding protein [Phaeodactylibacter sp.]MCB9347389.1 FMN-binding protein [Lewinellaceae bacterium]